MATLVHSLFSFQHISVLLNHSSGNLQVSIVLLLMIRQLTHGWNFACSFIYFNWRQMQVLTLYYNFLMCNKIPLFLRQHPHPVISTFKLYSSENPER